ncbi:RHS repeat-associated core domain-containing protein [Pseudomonas japonica]|uniref:RHS repeat-associated core domain-containing protein n=1 Tax=Pseudomonas japonica TaxID=256466 RepID=UPI0037F23939
MQTNTVHALLLAVDRHATPLAEASGGEVRTQRFSAYGSRTTSAGVSGMLGFNGEYPERTGIYLPGSYRAYSPALRRFYQADNLSPFAAGGLNPYAWCLGDPVNLVDSDGHVAWGAVAIVSAVLGMGLIVGAPFVKDERIRTAMYTLGGLTVGGAASGRLYLGWKRANQRRRVHRQARLDALRMLRQEHERNVLIREAARNRQIQPRLWSQVDERPPAYETLPPPDYLPPPPYRPPMPTVSTVVPTATSRLSSPVNGLFSSRGATSNALRFQHSTVTQPPTSSRSSIRGHSN